MKFELDQYNRNAPDDELIADVQRVARELGKNAVTLDEQSERGRFHGTTLVRRFGKWSAVLDKAGLQQTRTLPNVSEEELFKNLEEVWIKLGRQPRYSEMQRLISRYSAGTYEKRYGGWRSALRSFVSYINESETASPTEITESLTSGSHGKQLGSRTINWRLRFIVMRRDNFKCKVCGRTPATDSSVTLDIDHIKAWSKGGQTILENLQTLCTKCNIGKSDLEFLNSSPIEVQNV